VKKSNLQFVFPPADTPGGSVTKGALLGVGLGTRQGRATATNWRMRLTAKGATSSDMTTFIGVAPRATDGPDNYKYDKPPILNHLVSLDIIRDGGRYAQDLRSPSTSRKTWDLVVRSPKPNEDVTVSWPDIAASVPRSYQLTLVDRDGSARRNMRTASSYVVNTGGSATRSLQSVAEPSRNASRMQITAFDVVPNNNGRAVAATSVAIHYGFSDAAEARIQIRDGRGRTIRTLTATTRAAEGDPNSGTAVWDLKDDKGASLTSGVYNIELMALSQDGNRTRQLRPYLLTR